MLSTQKKYRRNLRVPGLVEGLTATRGISENKDYKKNHNRSKCKNKGKKIFLLQERRTF